MRNEIQQRKVENPCNQQILIKIMTASEQHRIDEILVKYILYHPYVGNKRKLLPNVRHFIEKQWVFVIKTFNMNVFDSL